MPDYTLILGVVLSPVIAALAVCSIQYIIIARRVFTRALDAIVRLLEAAWRCVSDLIARIAWDLIWEYVQNTHALVVSFHLKHVKAHRMVFERLPFLVQSEVNVCAALSATSTTMLASYLLISFFMGRADKLALIGFAHGIAYWPLCRTDDDHTSIGTIFIMSALMLKVPMGIKWLLAILVMLAVFAVGLPAFGESARITTVPAIPAPPPAHDRRYPSRRK